MGVEIEKKFLVHVHRLPDLTTVVCKRMKQAYIAQTDLGVVRVRVADTEAWITIKGANKGLIRTEFEYAIPVADANAMIANLTKEKIDKIRYYITYKGYTWELDQFLGDNEGLWLAEVELTNEQENPCLPEWVSMEVSGDARYYNSNLSLRPYKTW